MGSTHVLTEYSSASAVEDTKAIFRKQSVSGLLWVVRILKQKLDLILFRLKRQHNIHLDIDVICLHIHNVTNRLTHTLMEMHQIAQRRLRLKPYPKKQSCI